MTLVVWLGLLKFIREIELENIFTSHELSEDDSV